MSYDALIERYAADPAVLRAAVAGLSAEQLRARPISGQWSTMEVICHLADVEILYAYRIKLLLVEDGPTIVNLEPDDYVRRLACQERDVEEELRVVESVRAQMARILRALTAPDFQRSGVHTTAGRLTVGDLLTRIVDHLPHHVRFIQEKRQALAA